MNLSDTEKDKAVELAKDVAKYAFACCFYICFPNAVIERRHNIARLEACVYDLISLVKKTEE